MSGVRMSHCSNVAAILAEEPEVRGGRELLCP